MSAERPPTGDFLRSFVSLPRRAGKTGMGVVTSPEPGVVKCRCDWTYVHHREKVREDAVDRHFAKKHNGRGIRL